MAATQVRSAQVLDGSLTDADIASANKDGTAATPSLRTLGSGAQQACAGNDSRLTNATSVTAGNGSLTISPTTGAVVASVNMANANTWTAKQSFAATGFQVGTTTTAGWLMTADASGNGTWAAPPSASVAIGSTVTSGTAGSVLFLGAANVLAQDNTAFKWDHTNAAGTQLLVKPGAATQVGLALEPFAAQSANQQEWRNVSAVAQTAINATGRLITPIGTNNLFIGNNTAGGAITSASTNVCLGNSVGNALTSGTGNVILGSFAGNAINSGLNNVCIGSNAGTGITTSSLNMCIGSGAGQALSTNGSNVFVGGNAGISATGSIGVGVGASCFPSMTSGNRNVGVGGSTGSANAPGSVALIDGSNNTLIGDEAGTVASNTGNCVAIGRQAISSNNTCVIGSGAIPMNNIYFGKGITNATPTAYTINGTGGSGTDIAGAALQLAGGQGTGTGLGGSILFQIAPAGTTGTALNALVTKLTLADSTLTFADAVNLVFNATTGTKIGTATTGKLAFFGATPIVQPANTTDLRAVLINTGLMASGGATPLDLNGGNLTALDGIFTGSIKVGTNPAATGAVRLPNAGYVNWRNAGNSADLSGWRANASNYLDFATNVYRDDNAIYTDRKAWISLYRQFITQPVSAARDAVLDVRLQTRQSGTVEMGRVGVRVQVGDRSNVVNKTITGCANNGSGAIRVTTSATHSFIADERVSIYGVLGTTEANGVWPITSITATTFDLQGSTFTNAYTSGGTATNRGLYYGVSSTVEPTLERGGLTGTAINGDDVNCYVGYNAGTAKATDAYYLGRNTGISGSEFIAGFTFDSNLDYGIRLNGTILYAGLDFASGTFTGGHTVRYPNNQYDGYRNAAGNATLNGWRANAANYLDFGVSIFKDDNGTYAATGNYGAWFAMYRQFNAIPTISRQSVQTIRFQAKQASVGLDDGPVALKVMPGDRSDVVSLRITGATNATPVVITTESAHGLADGDRVNIYYLAGNTAAVGVRYAKVTSYSSTTFGVYSDVGLTIAVAGNGTYQTNSGWVTNRTFYYAQSNTVLPTIARGNVGSYDDVNCYVAYNGGSPGAKATDAYYLGRNHLDFPSNSEWVTGFTIDANCDYGIRINGTMASGAIDLKDSDYPVNSNSFYLRTPRDQWMPSGFGLGTQTPTYGFHQFGGGMRLQALTTPSAPTTSVGGGTPAGASSFYFVIAEDRGGKKTLVSAESSSAAAGSSTVNWRRVTWTAVTGAVKYYILRNTSSVAASNTLLTNTGTWTGTGISNITVTAGGSGYASAPTVSFHGGQGGTRAAATIAAAALSSVAVLSGGTQYTSVPTVVVSGGAGSGATCTASLGAYSAAVSAGGSGYSVGDYLTASGGTSTITALFRVDVVSGGVVTGVTIQRAGSYSVLPGNPVATTTGGAGTGCTLTVLWNVSAIAVTAGGSGYTSAPTISFTGGGASPAAVANVVSNAVANIVVTSPGAGELLTSIPGSSTPVLPQVVISGGGGSGATATTSPLTLEADDSGQTANGTIELPARNTTSDLEVDGNIWAKNGNARSSVDFTTTSLTGVDVTGMSFAVGVNEVWSFEFNLRTGSSSNTAGIKIAITFPSGATMLCTVNGSTTAVTAQSTDIMSVSGTLGLAFNTVISQTGVIWVKGVVANGATSGNVQLRLAKVTSGTATIAANSYLAARRLS